jgi:glyoxylase-like metal-dependent hydrolase (beta-lactamase superfamily II)
MAQYLDSLERLKRLDPPLGTIAPGHGSLIVDPIRTVEAVVAHRLEREALVSGALAGDPGADVDRLLSRVYPDVSGELRPVAAKSLWAHLRKLADEGRARSSDVDDAGSRWWPAG